MLDQTQPLQHAVEAEDMAGAFDDQINEYTWINDVIVTDNY